MSDREALLRVIGENPDDDAPRLVYADWLDEHGDPRQAEFIRVQCELARVPDEERRGHPLAAREQALWRELRKWRFAPANWMVLHLGSFRRGFNEHWDGPVPEFLRIADKFWRIGPIQSLRLFVDRPAGSGAAGGAAVAAQPALRQIRRMHVLGHRLDDRWVERFLETPHCDGWTVLILSGEGLTDAVCPWLAASRLAESECVIVVDSRGITESGRRVLERAFGDRHRMIGQP